MINATVFGGVLNRVAENGWRWADGTDEPRVTDLSASHVYNFRCRTHGGVTYVEVILSAVHREKDVLGWVLRGVESGAYHQASSGDHTGPLVIGDEGVSRMRIEPGEDPLLGHEPIVSQRAIPRVALVPVCEWDRWAKETPYGATWAAEHEPELFAKARSLGWTG